MSKKKEIGLCLKHNRVYPADDGCSICANEPRRPILMMDCGKKADSKTPAALSGLVMWVVYDHPSDAPQWFVIRKFLITDTVTPTDEAYAASTLDAARRFLPDGLVQVNRNESDDPVIVETWI